MAVQTLQSVLDAARGYLHDAGPQKTVTSISNATPPVVTVTSHGYTEGALVAIQGNSVAAYNGLFPIHVIDPNTFSLTGVAAAGAGTGGFSAAGGEYYPNSALLIHFNEPYRRLYNCLMGSSKRIQRVVYLSFPAYTATLVPSAYGLTDFAEPELIEERASVTSLNIVSTSATTPISVNVLNHGLSSNTKVAVTGVSGTSAPWGRWFITVTDANNFTLNGSVTDGNAGTGGQIILNGGQRFTEVDPIDLAFQGLDAQPQQYLGKYLWANEQLQFPGAVQPLQLRITYWASGAPPSNPQTSIGIDNAIDFLACATAANAARAAGWFQLADQLKFTAFGAEQEANGVGGLLGDFVKIQILTLQRGPARRRYPFRYRRSRFGTYAFG